MFEHLLSWLLLPLGVVLGINWSRRQNTPASGDPQGLAPLGRAAEADPAVIELQMTLGSLFRKRGEVERAIHLHEAVLARSSLPASDAAQVRLELAQDYLRAGLMDRAESMLGELVASGEQLGAALELLLDLYEQGRDWPQAIATAQRLESVRGSSLAPRAGQYLCEQAEAALYLGNLEVAQRESARALEIHRDCARASLLIGMLSEKREDWPAAIRAYQRVIEQDKRYLPEVLAPIKRCHEQAGDRAGYNQFLDDALADHPDSMAIALAKVQQLRELGEDAQAFLAARLARSTDLRALLAWLEGRTTGDDADAASVRAALAKRIGAKARYACASCGLAPSVLFWHCPSCKQWATIAPLAEIL